MKWILSKTNLKFGGHTMTRTRTPKSFAILLLAGAVMLPIAGCDSIERETGFNRSTQEGAVGGAAFGGIVAALADANPAWIAASVILGGVAGGAIGNSLGKEDAQKHARNNLHALDHLAEGQTESWENSQTGHSGSTTVHRVARRDDGTVCKDYTEIVHAGAQTVTRDGTVCRVPGGEWHTAVG
jgi:surface antigen